MLITINAAITYETTVLLSIMFYFIHIVILDIVFNSV